MPNKKSKSSEVPNKNPADTDIPSLHKNNSIKKIKQAIKNSWPKKNNKSFVFNLSEVPVQKTPTPELSLKTLKKIIKKNYYVECCVKGFHARDFLK